MKKKILGVLLVLLISIPVFSQDAEESYVTDAFLTEVTPAIISVLAGGVGIGVGYEHGFTQNFSALTNLTFVYLNGSFSSVPDGTEYMSFSFELSGRYYPFGNYIEKFFIGLSGIYHYIDYTHGHSKTMNVFEAGVLTGWKFLLNNGSYMFIEPGIGYSYAYGYDADAAGLGMTFDPGGLRLWFSMGWAF